MGSTPGVTTPSSCCHTWNWITFSVERHRYMRSLPWNWKAHLWSWEMGSSTSSMAYCFITFRMICRQQQQPRDGTRPSEPQSSQVHVPDTRRGRGLPGEAG